MQNLLSDNYVITNGSSRNETTLEGAYNFIEHRFEPDYNDLSNDFVPHITKANRSKHFNVNRVVSFGDQSNEDFVHVIRYGFGIKTIDNKPAHLRAYNMPELMIEDGLDTIWPRGLICRYTFNSVPYFSRGYWQAKPVIVLSKQGGMRIVNLVATKVTILSSKHIDKVFLHMLFNKTSVILVLRTSLRAHCVIDS